MDRRVPFSGKTARRDCALGGFLIYAGNKCSSSRITEFSEVRPLLHERVFLNWTCAASPVTPDVSFAPNEAAECFGVHRLDQPKPRFLLPIVRP
jgi:hypothetical protein